MSFDDFKTQAKQLSNILNGPSNISEKFLRQLWDASEVGDPSARVERAVNQLLARLEEGDVPGEGQDFSPKGGKKGKKEPEEKKDKKGKKKKDRGGSKESQGGTWPGGTPEIQRQPTGDSQWSGGFGNDPNPAGMNGFGGFVQADPWSSAPQFANVAAAPPQQQGFPPTQTASVFDTFDRNRDGAIDQFEWGRMGGSKDSFGGLDLNGDGKVTRGEWTQQAQNQNHDGFGAVREYASETDSDNDWWR